MEWVNEEFKKLRYIVNTISADVGVPSLPPVLPTLPLGDNQSQQLSITDVSDAAITCQAEETGNATPLTPSDADPHNTSSAIDTHHDTAISAVRDLQKEVKELLKVRLREVKEDFKQGLDVLRKRVDNLEAENLKLKSQSDNPNNEKRPQRKNTDHLTPAAILAKESVKKDISTLLIGDSVLSTVDSRTVSPSVPLQKDEYQPQYRTATDHHTPRYQRDHAGFYERPDRQSVTLDYRIQHRRGDIHILGDFNIDMLKIKNNAW
nr:hypothetical protein BaRGS_004916 [Batillaria attramentaria]